MYVSGMATNRTLVELFGERSKMQKYMRVIGLISNPFLNPFSTSEWLPSYNSHLLLMMLFNDDVELMLNHFDTFLGLINHHCQPSSDHWIGQTLFLIGRTEHTE